MNVSKIFNDEKLDVSKFVNDGKTAIVATKEEAIERTKKAGYFYPVYDNDQKFIGYGIPK